GTVAMEDVELGGEYYDEIFGGRVPAPIWQGYMSEAVEDLPAGSFPSAPSRLVYGDGSGS
ncbi:hypothetical protein PU560_07710, partial [Georgenia sp. 10Sc9-8]|nr:hypothetical protein [Georgenia halotolerans]